MGSMKVYNLAGIVQVTEGTDGCIHITHPRPDGGDGRLLTKIDVHAMAVVTYLVGCGERSEEEILWEEREPYSAEAVKYDLEHFYPRYFASLTREKQEILLLKATGGALLYTRPLDRNAFLGHSDSMVFDAFRVIMFARVGIRGY